MWMVMYIFFALLMSIFYLLLIFFLSNHAVMIRNKNTPFECGYDPKDTARMPFSLRFFLLGIVFLIFDVEVSLLFPLVVSLKYQMSLSMLLGGTIFLLILLFGLFHEWNEGSLSWVKW
uniref:NADH-ubiquinone oxidoreductase chain 3 n=1 Tax=Celleporella hyalina TaxID=60593 RepID=I6Q0D9_9BILA|nr:NADH dehydrogenase subunit 3 [Celleporella hyalina]AFJ53898.1 NADH dehydrogenase subunit 3 [Celleporella hyalina]